MTWLEFWEVICKTVGASGIGSFEFTIPELNAIAEGRDRAEWRHTAVLYDCGFNKNPSTFKDIYPYKEDFTSETALDAHKSNVGMLKRAFEGSGLAK
jgi:hypothetical protein